MSWKFITPTSIRDRKEKLENSRSFIDGILVYLSKIRENLKISGRLTKSWKSLPDFNTATSLGAATEKWCLHIGSTFRS